MGSRTAPSSQHSRFPLACGIFAVVASAQLVAIGASIASRTGETREVIRYIQSPPMIVSVPTLPDEITSDQPIQPRSIEQLLADYTDASDSPTTTTSPEISTPLAQIQQPLTIQSKALPDTAPSIAHPEVERLVNDAHSIHQAGDLLTALIKLEEAEAISPSEPAIGYRKALIFEDMGNWDKASTHYEQLFDRGPQIGVYYHKAAYKLSHGIHPETNKQNLLVIGRILHRISDDQLSASLTIPIQSTPNQEFDPTKLEVKIHHYDIVDNKKVEAVPPSRANLIHQRWVNPSPNWATHEEFIEARYSLPPVSLADAHIFGARKYFGYVTELYYKNKLVDQQAYPRRLHAIHAEAQNKPSFDAPFDFPFEDILPDINPSNPLLPALPSR